MIKGQPNIWFGPARRREEERAELQRRASEILAADRKNKAKPKWAPLSELRRVIHEKQEAKNDGH